MTPPSQRTHPLLRNPRQNQIKAKVDAEIARVRYERKKVIARAFDERRTTVRARVNLAATYEKTAVLKAPAIAKTTTAATVTEISRAGLRLLTADALTIGIWLEIDISFGAGLGNQVLRVTAKVVRLIANNERGYEYGLKLGADPVVRASMGDAVLRLTLQAAQLARVVAAR